jgi:hypothetical protein
MFKTMAFAAFAAVAFAGVAQARPDTRTMTCRQAVEFVRQNGPVVMNYGYSDRAGWLYEKFQSRACSGRQNDNGGHAAWVPTLDSPSCFIGYACRD